MNRLAFRIYDPENKCFHYSGSTPSMLSGYFKETATLVTVHGIKHQPATGLHDKNGVEIYEGDIVTAWSQGSRGTFLVKWREDGGGTPCLLLYPAWQHGQMWSLAASREKDGKVYDRGIEVIGKIHDNPELLSNTGGALMEIKFRGKRVDNGEWAYGYYLLDEQHQQLRHCIWTREFCGTGIANDIIEVIPETVGQFTGLHDKNGKKIYEGDIVTLSTYSYQEPINDYTGEILLGIYGVGILGSDCTGKKDCFWVRDVEGVINHFEVIGNIHDNQELLSNTGGA